VTAYAVDQLGDVVFVELPHVGQRVDAGSPVGEVESTKSVSDLYTPVTGTVTEVNEALADDPSLVNSAPYADGWLFRLAINAAADGAPPALLSATEYVELVKDGGS
jgi:glycine cleavage system H protein